MCVCVCVWKIWVYIYIYIYIYPNPLLIYIYSIYTQILHRGKGLVTGSVSKRGLTGLNLEFFLLQDRLAYQV